jgi:hypothetical protein
MGTLITTVDVEYASLAAGVGQHAIAEEGHVCDNKRHTMFVKVYADEVLMDFEAQLLADSILQTMKELRVREYEKESQG